MSRKRGKDPDGNEASLIPSSKKRQRAIDDTQRVLVPRHELQDPFWSPVAQHLSDTLWCPINTHPQTGCSPLLVEMLYGLLAGLIPPLSFSVHV